ncbi:MAG: ABC transporter ATP-binding protein [Bacilli bacterium]|nr:ABC transporter ATP-binding protein [Bacilli bacterium]
MKRLFNSLDKWRGLLIFGLILAGVSAVLSIIAPNILSNLTDKITLGIQPRVENIEVINNKIIENLTEESITKKIPSIISNENISLDDKNSLKDTLTKISKVDKKEDSIKLFLSLPDSILAELLDNIEIEKIMISKDDQLEYLRIMSSIDETMVTNEMLAKMEELPMSIYSLVEPKLDMVGVKKIALSLAIIYIVSAIFGYLETFFMATVSNNFAKKLRTAISIKINKLPLKYFDQHETGDVLSRVTNDVDNIGHNMNNSLATLVTSITLFVGSIIMMFITNWTMAITAIIASLVGFALMFLILGKSQKYFNQRQEELGKLNGFIEEIYSGHNVVKAYNGDKAALKEFRQLNDKLYESNRKSNFLSGIMQPIMGFVGNFGYVAVCVVGALLTMNGVISFGVIVAFMIYVRLFTNPLSQIAQAMTSLQSTAASSERVFEFLDEKEMSNQKDIKRHLNRSKVKGEIEFKNVKFGYEPGRTIIKNFSAKAKPGQKIAIVGPTGAGKTTMVNLLMKFYEINDGDILIDGVSTRDLTRENIHDLFVMVLQDTWLFEGTVGENIKFNKENISDQEIWSACKTVGIDHFIKTLPGGLDSEISDNEAISQGQKQLLTIARGMIEDAPFLILDEATSNVDTRTEELVQKAMDKLTEGRTSFIIAHRLSTIKNADLILVMKDGNIIEQGNHEELMKKNGFYSELYNSQFSK